jgi:broad specificity phosphatase PhoE
VISDHVDFAWVEGRLDDQHENWETGREAARRFDAAVRAYAQSGERVVIASHGMVITAWLVAQGRVEAGSDAGRFWQSLRFPDVIDVDLD